MLGKRRESPQSLEISRPEYAGQHTQYVRLLATSGRNGRRASYHMSYKKLPLGILASVLGAAATFYLAVATLVTPPSEGFPHWLAIAGLVTVSLIAGLLINGGSIQDYRRLSSHFLQTANLYNTLQSRLCPMIYSAVEEVLQRRVKLLDFAKDLNFSVFAPVRGLYRVVGSTFPPEDPIRQAEFEPGEGVTGFVGDRKIIGFAPAAWQVKSSDNPNRPVFDRAGNPVGEATPLRNVNRGKIWVGEKWVYCRPIFERSTPTPWSNRLEGLLMIHSSSDDGDTLFKNPDFQHQVDALASDVAPYLDVLQTLMAEER